MITLNRRVYRIDFLNNSTVYLVQEDEDFIKLLSKKNLIVKSITCTNDSTGKFKRISKSLLNSLTNFNTDLNILLQERGLI